MQRLNFQVIWFYLVLFSSPTLIDLIFQGLSTPLELGLIGLLWFYTFVFIYPKLHFVEKKTPDFFLFLVSIASLTVLVISWLVREIPLIVIVYRLFSYFSFYPLVYLLLYLRRNYKFAKKLLISLILLCNVIALGVIADSQGLIVEIPVIGEKLIAWEKESTGVSYKLRGGQRRGAFFLGGSTTVYPFLSLGILCNLILFKLEREKNRYLWLALPSLLLIWLGCFFSLSRAPLFLVSLFLVFSCCQLFIFTKKLQIAKKLLLLTLIVTFVTIFPLIQTTINDKVNTKVTKVFSSGISPQESANTARYYAWYQGLLLFTDLDSWLGNGLGTSTLAIKENKLLHRSQYRSHYESAIFSTFSEGGTMGLFILLNPFLLVIYNSQNHPHRDIYLFWMITLILNFFAAPIYGYSAQLAYFTGTSLCVAFKPKT